MLPKRKRNRFFGFDYSQGACYFVTSCVQNMACVFGKVEEEQLQLNRFGQIAESQWWEVTSQYPYLRSHAFVVMPNHMHALLEIKSQPAAHEETLVNRNILREDESRGKLEGVTGREGGGLEHKVDRENGDGACVRTGHNLSLPEDGFGKIKSLSQIMGAYKTTSSKLIRLAGLSEFAWQRSFHDHIVRDAKGFHAIKEYIENNPASWVADRFNRS
jgi:REP element-mobilizing transposase RayT